MTIERSSIVWAREINKLEFVELTKYLKKLLTPTLRNSLEYTYREEGKANDDSK